MCSKADWNNPQTSCKLCWNALFFAKQSAGREPKKVCSTFYRLHIYAEDREQQQQQTIKKKNNKTYCPGYNISYRIFLKE